MTPAEKLLAKAIRDTANKHDNDDSHNSDVSELARGLARVIEGKTIDQALGAPGDWGYESPIGSALYAYLQEPEPARHTYEWHYVADGLPKEDDSAVLIATESSGQPGEAVYRDGVFLWPGADIAIEGVYAWADLPEIPEQRATTPETKGGA